MHFSDEDVARILKLVDETTRDEIEVEWNGVVVRATRTGKGAVASASPPGGGENRGPEAPKSASAQGCVAVTAPVMGTIYLNPEPGKPPFVSQGSLVAHDDTLCLIEVMKVFTAVKAGQGGVVEKIFVEDGRLVEFGQPVFAIRPQ